MNAVVKPRVAWSYSRLNNFETCPKKFYHLAVLKDVREVEGDTTRYGKEVHQALQRRISNNAPLPLNLRYLERYASALSQAKGEFYTEMQLAIDAQFQPCDWFGKDAWCRAIVDLAILNPPSGVVVDYKTGRIREGFDQLRLAGAMLMLFEPQLERLKLCYLWTKEKQITQDEISRADIKTVFADLLPRIGKYEHAHHNELFPARPGALCARYCPVTQCPHHGEKHYS